MKMNTKDWFLLLIPIFCNGIVVFALQKIFEKRKIIMEMKMPYINKMIQSIDKSLSLHAKATRLDNENRYSNDNEVVEILQEYINNCLTTYYYFVENKNVFIRMDIKFEQMSCHILEISQLVNGNRDDTNLYLTTFSKLINDIRDDLVDIKNMCLNIKV